MAKIKTQAGVSVSRTRLCSAFILAAILLPVSACNDSSFSGQVSKRYQPGGGDGAIDPNNPSGPNGPTDPNNPGGPSDNGRDNPLGGLLDVPMVPLKIIVRAVEATQVPLIGSRWRGTYSYKLSRSGAGTGQEVEVLSYSSTGSSSSLNKVIRQVDAVCGCGVKNEFKMNIFAENQTRDLAGWSSHLIVSQNKPTNASDWKDFLDDVENSYTTGQHTVFLGGFDHGSSPCGKSSPVWNDCDDSMIIFSCMIEQCPEGGTSTTLSFEGM